MSIALSVLLLGAAVAADPATGPVRHIVMYKYQAGNTEEQTKGAVDAFRALAGKIDLIKDLEWGVNDSPEGLSNGYTHCFLVTFADTAGRDAYLPHPEHKAYAETAKPLREKVLVFDYVPQVVAEAPLKADNDAEGPLRHIVMFKFKDGTTPEDVKAVETAFAALPSQIDAIKGFEWGTNISSEGKSEGFTHCFVLTFADAAGRAAYLPHPAHKEFGKVLGPHLGKLCVVDYVARK